MPLTGATPMVPLFDLRLEPSDLAAVADTLRSGQLAMGSRVEAFETAFAEHLGVKHALCVSSCTAALHLAYLAAGIGPGDEVIVPSMTFAATANAVLYCGATPVFADIVGLHDAGIDPAHVETLIGPRTKAICAVHFAGYPAAVGVLRAICDRNGLALVEDAAHAPSATLAGRKLGTFGLAGAFSFFSNKILSCGEGGLLCTDDDDVAHLTRHLRSRGAGHLADHPGPDTDEHDRIGPGFNYRLDEPRAALLHARFGRLEQDIGQRRALVRRYRESLGMLDGLSIPYQDEEIALSSCYVMPVLVNDPARQLPLRRFLRDELSVQTSLLYPAVHEFTAYQKRLGGLSLPRAERWARSEVTIPLYPHMTHSDQDRVVEGIAKGLNA